jgi:hypothetical protein
MHTTCNARETGSATHRTKTCGTAQSRLPKQAPKQNLAIWWQPCILHLPNGRIHKHIPSSITATTASHSQRRRVAPYSQTPTVGLAASTSPSLITELLQCNIIVRQWIDLANKKAGMFQLAVWWQPSILHLPNSRIQHHMPSTLTTSTASVHSQTRRVAPNRQPPCHIISFRIDPATALCDTCFM